MRIPSLPRLLSLSSLVLAACAAGPTPSSPTWAPMPLGEVALPAHAFAVTHPDEIELAWTDPQGRAWNLAFRCTYATDDAHEAMAAACVQSHWTEAFEPSLAICSAADLDRVDGIAACEEQLQAQLTDVLFPCEAGASIGRVDGVAWTRWDVR